MHVYLILLIFRTFIRVIRAIAVTAMRYAPLATDRMVSELERARIGTARIHHSAALDFIAGNSCVCHYEISESGETTRMHVGARVSAGMVSSRQSTISTSTQEFELSTFL